MPKKAFLFPGQGSQYVGMAKDLFDKSDYARDMIKRADAVLDILLSSKMFNGPEDGLKQTEFTQPAIFLHSIVLTNLIKKIQPDAAAGHSLGEFSAHVSAGSIQFEDALKLVRLRGLAMQRAGIENPGTMAAIIGLKESVVIECCREASSDGIVQPANFNSPGQIVISGSIEGVRKAMEICKLNGAKLVKELVVSGAFHSPLMKPAQEMLKDALNDVSINNANIPVYANVTARPVIEKDEIGNLLYRQLDSTVRWEETINNMIDDGIEEFYEIGPGKVLQGLVKRINPSVKIFGIDKYSDLEKYL